MHTLNHYQNKALERVVAGDDVMVMGPGGCGKSTLVAHILAAVRHKSYLVGDWNVTAAQGGGRRAARSVLLCAWTNAAVVNLMRRIRDEVGELDPLWYFSTIHGALEHRLTPWRDSYRYLPKRGPTWPLNITHVIIDEFVLLSERLWRELRAAFPKTKVQLILLGDIAQLPAAFGKPQAYRWLLELPLVELSEVYRQAGDNPLLDAATAVSRGAMPVVSRVVQGKPLRGLYEADVPLGRAESEAKWWAWQSQWLLSALRTSLYDPAEDMILVPFRTPNRMPSGHWINAVLGGWLAYRRGAATTAVTCGDRLIFVAPGDRVRYQRHTGVVLSVAKAHTWRHAVAPPRRTMHRTPSEFPEAPLVPQAKYLSHWIKLRLEGDNGEIIEKQITEVPSIIKYNFELAHALTVHKAQGHEWRRIFLPWCWAHAPMANREMLYTALTRARECGIWLGPKDMISHVVRNQALPGDTLAEKVQYLKKLSP